jgi:ParB family chromosome partitioning protein
MTDTTTIALDKLLPWAGNVRKTDADKGIDELAASIAAHGLLQSLVVRKDRRGKYAVVAGRRRLLALKSLAKAETIDADRPIPCTIIAGETDATEISLAENVQREPMHPADEFDAFTALIEGGTPIADIAARFGVSETVVKQRLKLAKVSPSLIAAYRNGDMTLQHIMAFAVTDDHAAQERVWSQLSDWQKGDPEIIRDLLIEDEVTAQDRRVKFVTLAKYEEAGGTIRRDLFSEGEDGIFIDDIALLQSLVAKKLEATAEEVRTQGWKWVEVRPVFDHEEWLEYDRCFPESAPLPPEQQEEMTALTAEADALAEIEELDDDQQSRFDAINQRLNELENKPEVWPVEALAIAGAVVTLGHDGEAQVHYGFIMPEDASSIPAHSTRSAKTSKTGRPPLPASLIESLTAHRSAAITAALIERPEIALAATVHTLASQIFYGGARANTALQITAQAASLHRVEGSPAAGIIGAAGESWATRMPCNPNDLFAWCLAQDADTLNGLLAFCVANTVNAVLTKSDSPASTRFKHATELGDALKLDMTAWFTPTAANYFSKVSKTAGTGWLPEPLRAPAATKVQALEAAA